MILGPSTKKKCQFDAVSGVRKFRTVVDSATDKTGEREHAVEDTVGSVGKRDVLGSSSTKVRDGAEHACRSETKNFISKTLRPKCA